MLIYYEFRKLMSLRFIRIALVCLLLLNALLCVYSARLPEGELPSDTVDEFYEKYYSSPEELDEYHKLILEWQREQEKRVIQNLSLGIFDFEAEELPSVYAPEGFSDRQLFDKLYGSIDKITSYKDSIQKVIDKAESNLGEFGNMGFPDDSYACRYQRKVIELYSEARDNVVIGLENVRGWNEYFGYDAVNLFIFAAVLIVSSVLFVQEKQTGMMPLVRVSREGRVKTAISKISVLLFLTGIIVLIFSAETLTIFAFRLGLSNPANAIQVLDDYTYSYDIISAGEYLLLTLSVKYAAFALFALITAAVSVFLYNYALTFISGLGVYGLNYLLYIIRYINADSPLKNLNLISVSSVSPLFERFRSANVLGRCVGYQVLMPVAYISLILIFSALSGWKYCSGGDGLKIRIPVQFKSVKEILSVRENRTEAKYRLPSLFSAEIYKTLISSRYIAILFALLAVKCLISYSSYQPSRSFADAVYREYMTALAGEMTDEKRQYIADERKMINETIARREEVQQKYIDKSITYEDYEKYLKEYNYAYSRTELFSEIESHAAYIDRLAAEGKEAWFVYDTGWKTLFLTPFDWTLFAALLILFSGLFASEYDSRISSGGFAQILRVSKKGREKTFAAKMIIVPVISFLLSAIWNISDFVFIIRAYKLPLAEAPVMSLEIFGGSGLDFSITGYIILFYALRLSAAVMLALILCGMSCVFEKALPAMAVVSGLTLFPALLNRFGADILGYADFVSLMRATPMLRKGLAPVLIFSLCFAVITAAVSIFSKRKWER